METLNGQVALITGSSSGIGQGIAVAMARAGAKIGINYHGDRDGAKDTLAKVKEAGSEGLIIQADVSNPDDVQRMFQQTIETWGTVDILVNNAGMQKDAAFLEMKYEDWKQVIDTDLNGQFLCAQQAAKEFVRRGIVNDRSRAAGKIICISSVHDMIPWAGHSNYATSKGGVLMFMKTLAQELGEKHIRVNGIAPGAIQTAINEDVWGDPTKKANLLKLIPYPRLGTTEDVGRAATWLASDESDYIHGHMLYIDGGMTLYPSFVDNG